MWWARLLNVISGLLAGGVAASTNSYESIQTVTVGAGGQSSITFSSIPSTYKHLQIRGIMLTTSAGGTVDATLNSDTATNYSRHRLVGYGTGVDSYGESSISSFRVFGEFAGTGASPIAAAIIMDILDYSSANKNKTVRIASGVDRNGSGEVQLNSAAWYNSSTAVSSVTFTPSANFSQYSSFALYGIKG